MFDGALRHGDRTERVVAARDSHAGAALHYDLHHSGRGIDWPGAMLHSVTTLLDEEEQLLQQPPLQCTLQRQSGSAVLGDGDGEQAALHSRSSRREIDTRAAAFGAETYEMKCTKRNVPQIPTMAHL